MAIAYYYFWPWFVHYKFARLLCYQIINKLIWKKHKEDGLIIHFQL